MTENPNPTPLTSSFVWDFDAEQWVALIGLGGPAGTCMLTVNEVTLEFDRLLPGFLTRVFVAPDLTEEGGRLCMRLFGSVPPNAAETEFWDAPISRSVSREVWAVARLLADRGAAEHQSLTGDAPAFTHAIELAAAALLARDSLPPYMVERLCDSTDLAFAAQTLARHLSTHTWPTYSLAGLRSLWRTLEQSTAVSAVVFENDLSDCLEAAAVGSCKIYYRGVPNDLLSIDLRGDVVVIKPRSRITKPVLVTARLEDLVIGYAVVTGNEEEESNLNTVMRCVPDSLIVTFGPILESISGAVRGAEKAFFNERRCDAEAANSWAFVAEKWLAGRSGRRAREALQRSAMLAEVPSERSRFAALADCLDADEGDFCGLGMFWLSWWSAPLTPDVRRNLRQRESSRVNPSAEVVAAVTAN